MRKMKIFLMSLAFLFTFIPSVMAQDVDVVVTATPVPPAVPCITTGPLTPQPSCAVQVNQRELGFRIPSLSEILTFVIRAFFIIAGLVALVFLLLGALAWITSGGDKENISKAQSKITSAIVGVILVVVVLAIVVTLEQVVFGGRLCLGLSCPITIPSLLKPPGSAPGTDNGSLSVIEQEGVGTGETVVENTGTGTSGTSGNLYNKNVTPTPSINEQLIPRSGR